MMKNIGQTILPCIAALCFGLMLGILIGRFGVSPSAKLSTYDRISQDLPAETAPYRFETAGKININTADSSSLQEIPGVGPSTAEKIIQYRESNGKFQSIEDIKNVSGIGDKTFEKMKDKICV